MKRTISCIAAFFVMFYGLAQAPDVTVLAVKDSLYAPAARYYTEKYKSVPFDALSRKDFRPLPPDTVYTHRPVWFEFYIRPAAKGRLTGFLPPLADRIELCVPVPGGYRKYVSGRLSERPVRYDILESAAIFVPADLPDYSRPFYLHVYNITAPEAVPVRPGLVTVSDRTMPLHYRILREGKTRFYQIYLGIIALASLLFFISFLITADRNFLHYSLYLLALTAVFIHQIPFLHNLTVRIHPFLPGWISRMGIIATALAYFWFVVHLLETSRYAPRLDKTVRVVLIAGWTYAAWKAFQMLLWPGFPWSYPVYAVFHVLFMAASLFIFTALWFRPVPRIKKIIILGSYLLVAGHLFSMVLRNDFYFLNTVLVEIGLFFTIILMQYKRVHEERIRYKLNMLVEQQKRENLQALDEMKSKFFSHISHEFRTPLTLIHASLNRMEEANAHGLSRHIRAVRRHAGRLLELVDQLLDLTKLQSRAMRPQIRQGNLNRTVRLICESFVPVALEKKIRYAQNIRLPDDKVYFDKDFVQKILTNLISNAFKYTPQGGTVSCYARADDGSFVFEIENTGEGLRKEELERIFDRFYQKDEHAEGAGLGLALVKELVREHGGEIQAESRPGAWTRFTLVLPVDSRTYIDRGLLEEEAFPAEESMPEQEDASKPVLLVIEDHPEMRRYVAGLFRDDFQVLTAADGKEGIRTALERVPDIIISDVMMPEADGYKVCRELKNDFRTSHIPLILLTAKGTPGDKRKGTGCGAVDYIVKPFDEGVLKDKVRNWMRILEKHRKRYKQESILTSKDLAINDVDERFLDKLEEVLARNLPDPDFGVEAMAEAMNMSRMQLHRKLKALTGLSASAFLRSQRLKLAAQLLKNSRMSATEVAYAAGFKSPSYFTRLFKEAYGRTPAEFRSKQ